ncbi:hypothetical protein [Nitratireductor aquibiodomus]|uniref:hypothetical protein n=1 Tax=Nitratireductor aquibiodomus TaxID=204799 RepID=UPI000468CD24|nr:hypothetical protein [Nitratireductor aquibiodomus]
MKKVFCSAAMAVAMTTLLGVPALAGGGWSSNTEPEVHSNAFKSCNLLWSSGRETGLALGVMTDGSNSVYPLLLTLRKSDAAPEVMEARIAFDGESLLSMRLDKYKDEDAGQVDRYGARLASRDDIDAVLERLSSGNEMSIVIGSNGLPIPQVGSAAAVEVFESCLAKL